MKRCHSNSGVALVITLIMLSVITIIAVAFLLLSQRERTSISSAMSGTDAELMVDSGFSRGKAYVLAQMASFIATNIIYTNAANEWFSRRALGPDLTVSRYVDHVTNYPGPTDFSTLTNLLFDPSAPVFVGGTNGIFYHDLNRNGRFDETGLVPVRDSAGRLTGQTNYVIGDPQWIGVLARINQPHSASNRFVGRFAFLIIPAGKTLDVDFIHNRGKSTASPPDFFRNQGHASWEINLAALLADLNNNQWGPGYFYNPNVGFGNNGVAFTHANQILSYRYGGLPGTVGLRSARDVFGIAADAFAFDGIDEYADGDGGGVDNDPVGSGWSGAPNPQHFFTIHDFFNPKPQMALFQRSLRNAGLSNDTYNAYTFYRMLAQLATDSTPEKPIVTWNKQQWINTDARINLNYANTNDVTAMQFQPWAATNFLQVVGDRLLQEYGHTIDANTPLSVTNLPVYKVVGSTVTNYYTPEVHRILQMALNIFDAMTNNSHKGTAYPFYPTALKPVYEVRNGGNEIVIVNYREVGQNEWGITNAANWHDLDDPGSRRILKYDDFVYGVPVLIGAKKGFPNFNEFIFQNDVQFERKLQVMKTVSGSGPNATSSLTRTNQIFYIGVSNSFGLEAWNSYSNAYPRPLTFFAGFETTLCVTNDDPRLTAPLTNSFSTNFGYLLPANNWRGGEFKIPDTRAGARGLWGNNVTVDYKVYYDGNFYQSNSVQWTEAKYPAVQWGVSTTNRVRFFLFDNGYLVDAVGLAPVALSTNVTEALTKDTSKYALFWKTERGTQAKNVTLGMERQLAASQGGLLPNFNPKTDWDEYGYFDNRGGGAAGFKAFLSPTNRSPFATNMMAPYTPQVKIYRHLVWRANDPLVHYMDRDLRYDRENKPKLAGMSLVKDPARTNFVAELGKTNRFLSWAVATQYAPWAPDPNGSQPDLHGDLHLIDPNIRSSNDWDFPTNISKLPSIGWLGRIHRGTPWQTVYFKSAEADPMKNPPDPPTKDQWMKVHYSMREHPTNDWRLADIFTVAQHPNASRGRLSVNQTNLAAWSGLLSGIEVTRLTGTSKGRTNIEPAAANGDTNVQWLVESINLRRESLRGKVFQNLAEFLAVPELTVASPYLNPATSAIQDPLRDEDYEAIPDAIMSLIKPGEARFVIYAFGQSLKPAPQSVLPGGNYRGLCLNYEVTGEMAARAVVRVELDYQANGPPRPRAVVESYNILPPD